MTYMSARTGLICKSQAIVRARASTSLVNVSFVGLFSTSIDLFLHMWRCAGHGTY